MVAELGINREQVGSIFGAFTLALALASPLAALAIARFGLRVTIAGGALLAALGFFLVGRAESLLGLYLSYALLGGLGIGFSTLLPVQTLAVNWFRRYRARATAIVLLGAGVVGALVTPADELILRLADWRTGWSLIALVSVLVAVLTVLFVRTRPEDVGQLPDGDSEPVCDGPLSGTVASETVPRTGTLASPAAGAEEVWRVVEAVKTPQFLVATFAGMANTVPWRVLTAHGRLHFEDLGFASAVAAAILGVRVGMSSFGRISGSLCDFVPPNRVLALALLITATGLAGLLFAEQAGLAYLWVALLGFGYGAAFTSEPVVFAHFFGRSAFAGTSGLRIVITGVVGFLGPTWAGASADQTGSYTATLIVLASVCVVAAIVIFPCPRPRLPGQPP